MPVTLQDVREDSTYQVTGTFKDEAGVAIDVADLTTVKMWITDHLGVTINSRSGTSIKNANGGVITSSGVLTLTLLPADNPIVGSEISERHLLIIEWTWASTKKSHAAIYLMVVNDSGVPTA